MRARLECKVWVHPSGLGTYPTPSDLLYLAGTKFLSEFGSL